MTTIFLADRDYRYILFPDYITYTGPLQPLDYPVYIKQKDEDLSQYLKEMQRLEMKGIYEIDMPTVAQYSLDTPESILQFMITYLGYPEVERVQKKFKNLLEEEKKEFIKLSKAYGTWYTPIFKNTIRVYKLLEAMAMGKMELLRAWYNLVDHYSVSRLWASFLTFSIKIYQYKFIESTLPWWYKESLGRACIQRIDFSSGLKLLKGNNLPYEVLVPRILLSMRELPLDNADEV